MKWKKIVSFKLVLGPDLVILANMWLLPHCTQTSFSSPYRYNQPSVRLKFYAQVLQGGGLESPTKPKGRPKKNSIPTSEQLSEQEKSRETDRLSDSSSSTRSDSNQEE